MNIIMLGVTSLLLTCTYRFWRIVVDRDLYFELQAIRDRLRWHALTHPEIREEQAFLHFDRTVGGVIKNLETLSFWTQLLAKLNGRSGSKPSWFAKFEADISADPVLSSLFARFGSVLIRRLLARHVGLVAIVRFCSWFRVYESEKRPQQGQSGILVKKQKLEERVLQPTFDAFC